MTYVIRAKRKTRIPHTYVRAFIVYCSLGGRIDRKAFATKGYRGLGTLFLSVSFRCSKAFMVG